MLAMERELTTLGHSVTRERLTPVYFKGDRLCLYRIDMVVDDKLIIETKATEQLHPRKSAGP